MIVVVEAVVVWLDMRAGEMSQATLEGEMVSSKVGK